MHDKIKNGKKTIMKEISLEKLHEFSELMVTPTFLVQAKKIIPLNIQCTAMADLSYRDLLPIIDETAETIDGRQLAVKKEKNMHFFTVNGRKVLHQNETCWLLQIMPIAEQETFQNITRISTARKIMLQMANDFVQLDTDQSVYEFILEKCGKAVQHSDLCSLMILHHGTAHIVAKRGYGDDVYNINFDPMETFLGVVTEGKFDRPVIINDLSKFTAVYHTEIKTESSAQLLGSTLCTPVYIKQKLYAILCFDSTKKNAFTDQDLELLELIKGNVEAMLANHQMQMEILHLSKTDMLTGLYNRTYLKEFLCRHNQERFYVGMFDMNDLKGINDGHGHNNGDLIIRTMASSLKKAFPPSASIFRIGGDEFMTILYKLNLKEILDRIEILRQNLLRSPITLSDHAITTLSFSCGFALHEENMDFEAVLSQADTNMYIEKRKIKGLLIPPSSASCKDPQ